jgi:DNA-directed RNA polymerase
MNKQKISCQKIKWAYNHNVFGVVETWTNSESNTSLPGFTAMHEPDVKQNGKRGVLVAL